MVRWFYGLVLWVVLIGCFDRLDLRVVLVGWLCGLLYWIGAIGGGAGLNYPLRLLRREHLGVLPFLY